MPNFPRRMTGTNEENMENWNWGIAATQKGLVLTQQQNGVVSERLKGKHSLKRSRSFSWWHSRDFALEMVNVKRLPGVFFTHKIKVGLFALSLLAVLCFLHHWGFMCTSHEIRKEIQKLCKIYDVGEAVGNLCNPLCKEKTIESMTCKPQTFGSEFVFAARWNNRFIVFKSSFERGTATEEDVAKKSDPMLGRMAVPRVLRTKSHSQGINNRIQKKALQESDVREASEKVFEAIIRGIIIDKLNVTVTKSQLKSLRFLDIKKNQPRHPEMSEMRKTEKMNLFQLLQSREYLISRLFSDREIFPQVVGTCGYFFAVEHLRSPQFNSFFMLDDAEEWSERMKLAIEIMDFIDELETNFPDALHLCDIRMSHFGVTNAGHLKFLDLNSVYTNNMIDKMTATGKPCHENEDCDFHDCKSVCNPRTKICDAGIANNNLQVICEKVFVGWTMSGKIIIPGLLMSEHTPASLATLLRLCAENGRSPVPEDIRQRLYTTLTEMYQIIMQRLSE